MYRLTNLGIRSCEHFIRECNAKRKEILDAGKDTADETNIPTVEDIECDINFIGIDQYGEYLNSWGVTDHYDSDYPLRLILGSSFIEV